MTTGTLATPFSRGDLLFLFPVITAPHGSTKDTGETRSMMILAG